MLPRAAAIGLLVAAAASCARLRPRSHLVRLHDFGFAPDSLVVAVGDTVVFRNDDVVPHTATRVGGGWDSGELGPGASWRLVVRRPGAEHYYCRYHPGMRGVLRVR